MLCVEGVVRPLIICSDSFTGIGFDDGGSDDEDGRPRGGNKQSTEAKYVL